MTLPSIQRVARIQRTVAAAYGVDLYWMRKHGRRRKLAWPRQVAMYLARETTGKSLEAIGQIFGGFDHTTVIHAIRAVEQRMATIPDYRADIEALRARCAR